MISTLTSTTVVILSSDEYSKDLVFVLVVLTLSVCIAQEIFILAHQQYALRVRQALTILIRPLLFAFFVVCGVGLWRVFSG